MTPGVVLREEQQNLEKQMERQMERQMGCMAGLFQLFDRHQILAGKRIYSTKRLPSSPGTNSPSPSERSDISPPSFSKDSFTYPPTPLEKPSPKSNPPPPTTTTKATVSTADTTARTSTTPLPLPVFEFKDGAKTSWKLREAPRLSLDSRLRDNNGKLFPHEIRTTPVPTDAGDDQDRQRRSPSVVARLMGLDLLPHNGTDGVTGEGPIATGVAKLRRSASESRATKEFLQYPFLQQEKTDNYPQDRKNIEFSKPKSMLAVGQPKSAGGYSNAQTKKKSSFNAQDFYPEPSRRIVPGIGGGSGGVNGNLYGEIEKRLRMRGVDEPSKDLETLKQILEALQLKGLLHSSASPLHSRQINRRNMVVDQRTSPIVLMKPPNATKSSSPLRPRRKTNNTDSRERSSGNRWGSAPCRLSPDLMNPTSPARRKPGNLDRRMSSPAQSPRSGASPRRSTPPSDQTNKSPRTRKPLMATERFSDESSTISDGSYGGPSSHFDIEVKIVEYREGRSLLERCDKLLHSIAEITSSTTTVSQQQPSPVSVLDTGDLFRSDAGGDLGSPPCSSNLKRRIEFEGDVAEEEREDEEDEDDDDDDGGEERWRPVVVVPTLLLPLDDTEAGDRDFAYVAEIFRSAIGRSSSSPASIPLDVYTSLENLYSEDDNSKASRMYRRLVFDTVVEIADKNGHVSPWESFSRSRSVADCETSKAPARETWAELKRIREPVLADDLCELVCGVLRKDLTGYGGCVSRETKGWSDRSFEMSDAVLDIERLIFKDLVAETIKGLASSSTVQKRRSSSATAVWRRKLLF